MWWAAAAMIAVQAAPAPATGPGSRAFDMQCMLVAQQIADDPAHKDAAATMQSAALFFMGRTDAQITDDQFVDETIKAAQAVEGRPIGPLLASCAKFMQERGGRFVRLGQEAEKRAGKPARP